MNDPQLLERIAATLKRDIGPAIEAEYPKTQAFMAAVVLQKLARELGSAAEHRAAAEADLRELLGELKRETAAAPMPAALAAALARLGTAPDAAALSGLVTALYQSRVELGAARFEALLRRVRKALRRDIDRRMEYSA